MAKLRHLGIRTEDTGKLASFYVDVFDMKVIHKSKEEGGTIFLSDGYFNLAIIPNKDQNATNGLYHFGFEVESGEAIVEKMKKINPTNCRSRAPTADPMPRPAGRIRMATISTSRNMVFSMCNRLERKSRAEQPR